MPREKIVDVFLLVACVASTQADAQVPAPARFQSIRQSILEQLSHDSIPSLSVAVAKDGKILWEEAFGYADLGRRVPASTATQYPLASVSKPLTATALMVFVQQGRLSLTRPANDYLEPPGIRALIGSTDDVTLARLASHTSGLARFDLFYYPDEPHQPLPVGEVLRRYGSAVRPPGESYEYSNLGYAILAHIMARRSERTFDNVLREAVFDPLGMSHSSFGPSTRAGTVAVAYDAHRRPVSLRETIYPGPGGVYSSAGDLVRFGMFHLGHTPMPESRGLAPATLRAMREPLVQTDTGEWYGLGWRINRTAFGVETVFHTGSNGASSSIIAFVPGEDLAVAVLANCLTFLPGRVAREVIGSFGPRPTPVVHPPAYPTNPVGVAPYRPTNGWTGRWGGFIHAPDGAIPVVVDVTEAGRILVSLSGGRADTAGGVRIEDGYLRGSFSGEIPNRDTLGRRYRLHFKLRSSGNRLTGSVTAGHVSGERVVTLTYWTDLRRASP